MSPPTRIVTTKEDIALRLRRLVEALGALVTAVNYLSSVEEFREGLVAKGRAPRPLKA